MGFIALVAVIAGWIYLSGRISKLEEQVQSLSGHAARNKKMITEETLSPIPQHTNMTRPVEPLYSDIDYSAIPVSTEPSAIESFFAWCKEDLMVKIGALLLIIAFGWFVTYAIAEQWIGPMGQITIGLLAGIAFMALGTWRMNTRAHQGAIFTVLGSTIILLVMFAAREIYDLFTPLTAMFVIFMAISFVAFVSVRYDRSKLSYVSLFMASIAPAFVGIYLASPIDLFVYLLVITAGSLWIVFLTGWTKLILLSLIVTSLYSSAFIADGSLAEMDTVLIFSFVFVSIYFIANIVSLIRRKADQVMHVSTHVLTALLTAIFLVGWIEYAVPAEWKSLLYVAWAMVFAVGTYLVYSYTTNTFAFYLYGAVSTALIGIATAAELDGSVLVFAYFFEICLLLFAAGKLKAQPKTLTNLSLLLAIPLLLSLESFGAWGWRGMFPIDDFAVLSVAMFVSLLACLYLRRKNVTESQTYVSFTSASLIVIALGYATSLVWLVSYALLPAAVATMIPLFLYTIFGITMFVLGSVRNHKFVKIVGVVFVSGVVLRLLLIDVWEMPLVGRIITFLGVGIMLISTAFINKINGKKDDNVPST